MGWSETSPFAVYAIFSHFCYVGGFGDLGDPVVPTLRGVSGDTEGRFLQSLSVPRAGRCRYKRCEMAASTNNGLVNGLLHTLFMLFFTLDNSKIEVFGTYSYDIVIT